MPIMRATGQSPPAPCRPAIETDEFRQLRHHARNALQRILSDVLEAPGLNRNCEGRRIAEDVAGRIELSAAISDALFGCTVSPDPLPVRLRSLSESVIALYTDATQIIRLDVAASDNIGSSPGRENVILRIVHELVANAVTHGMHMRLLGRISIRLVREAGGPVAFSVANDGWQMDDPPRHGTGLELVGELVRAEGGEMSVTTRPHTMIEVHLPREGSRPAERAAVPSWP